MTRAGAVFLIAALLSASVGLAQEEDLSIQTNNLKTGRVGEPYSEELQARGGRRPYQWSLASGSLPLGLSLNASSGRIEGTPTEAVQTTLSIRVTDAESRTATRTYPFTITAAAISISTNSPLPSGTMGVQYSQTFRVVGGIQPYQWSIDGGSIPAGLTFNAGGELFGTPTAAGQYTFRVRVRDNQGDTVMKDFALTIAWPPVVITTTSLPGGTVGVVYSQTLAATGGTGSYSWSVTSGSLPAGLSLSSSGAITGTPQNPGAAQFTVQAADTAAGGGGSASRALSITIAPPPVNISTASLPDGTVGVAYSQQLAATGGTGSYTWSLASGSLPAGLSLSNAGAITGTPEAAGASQFTVRAADASSGSATRALSINIVVPPVGISTSSLPDGTVGVAYSQQLTATGGTGSYTWSLASGSLPAGLSLSNTGAITGRPQNPGSAQFTVQATDTASGGGSATRALSINVAPPPLIISTNSLPAGTVGVAYSQQLTATGGFGTYTWSVSSGSLPSGLSLSAAGVISGTPQNPGTSQFSVRVADTSSGSATRALSINIAAPALNISNSSLPGGSVGVAYSQTLTATGGFGSQTWSIVSGSLPTGLSLNSGGVISGTPQNAGAAQFTVRVADSASGSATRALSITISPALAISACPTPSAGVGQPYSSRLNAANGTAPYSWTVSTGALPAGLQLATDGVISGTPSASGSFNFGLLVSDGRGANAALSCAIAVSAAITISTSQLLSATTGTPYSVSLMATGGSGPYTWSLRTGSLPNGITLSGAGLISGTATAAGNYTLTVRAADASGRSAERQLTLDVLQALAITGCPQSVATSGGAYSATLRASGGREPYTFVISAGGLPGGLTLAFDGNISGTPVVPGSYSFGIRAGDATGSQATQTCTIVVQSGLAVAPTSVPDATLQVAYSHTLQAIGGTPPYAWSSEPLPAGLQLNPASGQIAGTPTAAGDYSFAVQVRDSVGTQAQRAVAMRVGSGLVISTCPVVAATIGAAYASTLATAGAEAPVLWAIANGSLPSGLALDTGTGAINGTPQTVGQAQFTIRATDARSTSATRVCTIDVSSALTIVTSALGPANLGSAYSDNVNVAGGAAPYTFSTTAGTLPPGLLVSTATGQISGTPAGGGSFRFTIRVTDARGASTEREFTIGVNAGLVIPACPAPVAIAGETYSSSLQATLGQPPYTWSVSAGSLPAGLSLNAQTGIVTGAASGTGTAEFTVRVVDSTSAAATRSCTMIINDALLSISGADVLPDAFVGTEYTFELKAAGGKGPYVWAIADGGMPGGLRVEPSGRLTGIPSAAGAFAITIQVTDSNNTVTSRRLQITVQPGAAPSVSFMELPEIVGPAQQVRVAVQLDGAYPQAVDGQVRMAFVPDPGVDVDDTSIQFATGGRRVTFRVPPGDTAAVFPIPELRLQTGTVAGTIQLAVELSANGQALGGPAIKSMRIDRLAPRLTNVRVVQTSSGFEVRITGFSTTREVSQAAFRFATAAGSSLETSDLSLPMTEASRTWFSDSRSHAFGSQFLLVQPFTVQNATLSGVTVTLTNGQGTSQPMSAQF